MKPTSIIAAIALLVSSGSAVYAAELQLNMNYELSDTSAEGLVEGTLYAEIVNLSDAKVTEVNLTPSPSAGVEITPALLQFGSLEAGGVHEIRQEFHAAAAAFDPAEPGLWEVEYTDAFGEDRELLFLIEPQL